jgi:hypothetical protein
MDGKGAAAAAAGGAKAAVASGPASVEQCRVLQQVIKLLEHTDEAKKMLPLANMTPEMLQTTLQVRTAVDGCMRISGSPVSSLHLSCNFSVNKPVQHASGSSSTCTLFSTHSADAVHGSAAEHTDRVSHAF